MKGNKTISREKITDLAVLCAVIVQISIRYNEGKI